MEFDFADVLIQVMERNASDLHLTAGSPPMIRYHGALHALDYPVLTPQATREVIYSILTNEQRQRLETDWQIDLAYSIPGRARFRVNAYFQRASLSAAFRLIPQEMPKLRDLGLPNTLEEFTKKPRGFVLVTGPTGSGKSTTLAAMIDLINDTRHEHILTIEDPIEFLHMHKSCIVNQRELGADAQSFALGLKAGAPPGPRRDPRRRDARPRDDLHRADRGGDRPPRVRHAPHPGHGADRGPHRGRVPAGPAAAGARAAVGGAPGHRDPAAPAARQTAPGAAWPPRSSCPPPRSGT